MPKTSVLLGRCRDREPDVTTFCSFFGLRNPTSAFFKLLYKAVQFQRDLSIIHGALPCLLGDYYVGHLR